MILRHVLEDIIKSYDNESGPPPSWAVAAVVRFVVDIEGVIAEAKVKDPKLKVACWCDGDDTELVIHSSACRQVTFEFLEDATIRATHIDEHMKRREWASCETSFAALVIRRLGGAS